MDQIAMMFGRTAESLEQDRVRCIAAFDQAYALGGFGPDTYPAWSAYVNRDILAMYGDGYWIALDDVAPLFKKHAARMHERFEDATWRKAGNLFHYARGLGLIVEEPHHERGRGWRLVHREPQWIVEGTGYGKRAVQVRGLSPAEQDARDRYEAKMRRLHATLDRKARLKADVEISDLVDTILRRSPGITVPEYWRGRGFVPDWLLGNPLAGSATVVRETHHAMEMDRRQLREWIRWLGSLRDAAGFGLQKRLRDQAELPEHAEIPADDADALGGLL